MPRTEALYTRMLSRAEECIDKDELKTACLYLLAALAILTPKEEE